MSFNCYLTVTPSFYNRFWWAAALCHDGKIIKYLADFRDADQAWDYIRHILSE